MGRVIVHVHSDDATWIEHLHPRSAKGQFALSTGTRKGSHHHELPFELQHRPQPRKPFLILRVGRKDETSLEDRDAGNVYGVAERLAEMDEGLTPSAAAGGDTIHVYIASASDVAGGYVPLHSGHAPDWGVTHGVGYREHDAGGGERAIAVSFGQDGFRAHHLTRFPVAEVQRLIGGRSFKDAGCKISGDAIREVMRRYLGKHTHDDWQESQHPRGGHPENKGEFSVKAGSGASAVQVHVHRDPGGGNAEGARQTEQSLYDDVDFDPEKAKQYDPAPKPKNKPLHIHVPHPGGETFASPNIHELPSLTPAHAILTAQAQLATHRQKLFEQAAADVDRRLGITPAREAPAIGAWQDGAEGTTVMVAPHATEGQLRLSAAMKGWLGQQKAVLSFTADPKGTGTMYQGLARGTLDDIHRQLLADGIENHTLEPAGAGVRIFIADTDGTAAQHVSAFAVHHRLTFSTTKGRAEFIGAKHYEGTSDAQQRAEAQGEYEFVIAHSGVAGSSGIPAAELWRGLRDRWAQALLTTQDRRGPVELTYDLEAHVFVEAEHPRRGKGPGGGEFAPKGEGGASGGGTASRSFAPKEPTMHVHVHQPAPAASAASAKPALKGSKGHAATISSRFPTAIKGTEKPDENYLQTGLEAMKANPQKFHEAMELLKIKSMYPHFRGLHGHPDEIAEQALGQMVDNLVYFAKHAPPLTRKFGTAWYREENRKAQAQAKRYGVPLASVAGAYAALSPQKDWNMNVYLGDRVMEAMSLPKGEATKWSARMDKIATVISNRKESTEGMKRMIELARGKSLEDLDTPLMQAVWVRMWDEAKPPKEQLFKLFRPDGEAGDYGRTDKGKPQKAQWGGFNTIANSIEAFQSGGDRTIISRAMGEQNKVRSFYNNILDPESANGDLTVDTHAIGAALFDALGGSTAPVAHGLGSSLSRKHQPPGYKGAPKPATTGVAGLYGLYAEAYRRAAKQLGMRPLELQSLTWEAKRALFEHMPAGGRAAVHKAWEDYHAGKGTFEEAREAAVKAAGGFKEPDWIRPLQELTPEETAALEAADEAA